MKQVSQKSKPLRGSRLIARAQWPLRAPSYFIGPILDDYS